ncbi:MAG: sugar ABC transporter substrate-binding protein [Chloroflexota bacterium]
MANRTGSTWGSPLGIAGLVVALVLALASVFGARSSLASGLQSSLASRSLAPRPINLAQLKLPKETGAANFETPAAGSGKGLKLGYISLGEQVPFVHLVTVSIKKAAAAAGTTMIVCDSREQTDVSLQCAKNFKTQGVQGYLNFQSDAASSASICAAGPSVPVIAIDIHQAPCEKAFMGANNLYGGIIAGMALGKYAKQNFHCTYDAYVSLEEPAAGIVNDQRMGGFRQGFKRFCPIHNLLKENAFRVDQARTVFADVLTRLTGKHRIFVAGLNDDGIVGAEAAARTAGRVKDLFVGAEGGDPTAWCGIKKNPQWVADATYFPERYGEIGVPNLIRLVKGQSVPKLLLVRHRLINARNIGKLYKFSCK